MSKCRWGQVEAFTTVDPSRYESEGDAEGQTEFVCRCGQVEGRATVNTSRCEGEARGGLGGWYSRGDSSHRDVGSGRGSDGTGQRLYIHFTYIAVASLTHSHCTYHNVSFTVHTLEVHFTKNNVVLE